MATQKEVKSIGVATTVEDVVKYDSEGYKLKFSEKDFLMLSPAVLKELSRGNRESYFLTKGMYDLENDSEAGDSLDDLEVSPENMQMFTTIKTAVEVKPGLTKHFARPDRIDYWKSRGYRMADQNDLQDVGKRDSLRVKHGGYDDVVLMVSSDDVRAKYRKVQQEYRAKLAGGKAVEDGRAEITNEGLEVTTSEVSVQEE